MAARPAALTTLVLAAVAASTLAVHGAGQAGAPPRPSRIVSLVPALTEMLFDMNAGAQVIAVSRYDSFPAQVRALPRVGSLLDPDYEAIVRLQPDLVVTYASQAELERRLQAGGIRFYSYRHAGVDGTLRTMRELGAAVGHAGDGIAAANRLSNRLDAVRSRVRGLPRPRTLLVFGRDRGSLRQVYASGGVGFEHEILEMAGGSNVFADVRRESVQPSMEMLLALAPEVIVELHAGDTPDAATVKADHDVWRRLSSTPAVRTGRVYVLYADYLSIPGPRLGEAAESIARVLHPDAFGRDGTGAR